MLSLKSPSVRRALGRGNRLDEYEKNFVLKVLRKRPEIARGESYKTNLIRYPSWTLVPNLMLARFLTVILREGSKKISMNNPMIVSFMMSVFRTNITPLFYTEAREISLSPNGSRIVLSGFFPIDGFIIFNIHVD